MKSCYNLIVLLYRFCGKVARIPDFLILRLRLLLYGAKVGEKLRVRGWINLHISPKSEIIIGNRVMLKSGFTDNPTACSLRTGLWCYRGSKMVIGDNTGVFGTTIICSELITIGNNTLIAGGTHIYDSDFHSLDPAIRTSGNEKPEDVHTSPVRIGSQCWIGSRCLILKGVTIGDQAVIGAGSMVTKNIPSRQLWAGNPAKFIKEIVGESK